MYTFRKEAINQVIIYEAQDDNPRLLRGQTKEQEQT